MSYQDYLQSKEWKDFATTQRKRVGYRCERCKVTGKPLHVHHKHYKRTRDKQSWKLPKPSEVVVLCDVCHRSEHGIIRV